MSLSYPIFTCFLILNFANARFAHLRSQECFLCLLFKTSVSSNSENLRKKFFTLILYLMKILLEGEVPSKKNSRINTKSGKSFPSKRYTEWHNQVVSVLNYHIAINKLKRIPEGTQIKLTVTFIHADLKRRDSDNQLSSVLDTLVDTKIIPDDNWKIIPEKHIYDKYEKNNARCEIEIEVLK